MLHNQAMFYFPQQIDDVRPISLRKRLLPKEDVFSFILVKQNRNRDSKRGAQSLVAVLPASESADR